MSKQSRHPVNFEVLMHRYLQREELRARFPGVPGDLVNFFLYVAEEVTSLYQLKLITGALNSKCWSGAWHISSIGL